MNALNSLIVKFVKLLPKQIVYIFAKRYIAGTKLKDAVKVTKNLNEKGIVATMDVLGESISTREEAEEAKDECIELLETINREKLEANLSIKPTQLGLGIDEDFCYDLLKEIVEKALSLNNFVRIDMEDSPFTDRTIRLFKRLRTDYPNVGIVVQAYLKRTLDDVKDMNAGGAHYRLCKGIYVEPAEIAYKDRQEVRDNFMKILGQMLDDKVYVGIATHDEYLVDESYKMLKEKNIPGDKYEFQMLYGVRETMRDRISRDGHKMRIYVPFGVHWYAYSIRRLQENPQMAWYITKSILTFGR